MSYTGAAPGEWWLGVTLQRRPQGGVAVATQVREHARRGGFPANHINQVKTMIDPTTAEAHAGAGQ
jgi:hypothetical protein